MSGSHHVWCRVSPSGIPAVANYDDKIVPAMRRYNKAVAVDHKEPRASDVEAIMTWWQANAIASENCRAGVCGHTVS